MVQSKFISDFFQSILRQPCPELVNLLFSAKYKLMFKKYSTLILTILLFNLAFSQSAFAETNEEKTAKFTEKVKTNIVKLGTGKDARVEVKLHDKTKLKGYISQINENSFVLVDEKTGAPAEVSYRNAKQVKGNNLSTGVKIAIVAAGVLAVILIISIFTRSS